MYSADTKEFPGGGRSVDGPAMGGSREMRPPTMMICLPYRVPPHTHTAADTAHSVHSTQPALRPHCATPSVEDKPSQTRRPRSIRLCSPLSEGPHPGLR